MYEMCVVAGDFQIPFHNVRAVETWLNFIRANSKSITTVVLNGDILDFPYLSLKFLRDPAYRLRMRDDIATFKHIRVALDAAAPNAQKYFILGNHEERWTKYVQANADEMAWLLAAPLSLPTILGVDGLPTWQVVAPYGDGLDWHGLLIQHGTRISPHSAYAARAEYLDAGTSGISGHTHRGGAHFHTDRSGAHAWYEGFCLCNTNGKEGPLPPADVKAGVRNQQQGIIVVEWWGDTSFPHGGLWNVSPLVMTHQRFVWNRVLYTPKE